MIWPNRSATDYKFALTISASSVVRSATLPHTEVSAEHTVTYGVPYSLAPAHGFKFTAKFWATVGSSTINYEVVLSTPWGNTTKTGTLAGFGPLAVRVELDDVVLTVPDCENWTLATGNLRLYINDTLEHTITGPLADSGAGYDRRENTSSLVTVDVIAGDAAIVDCATDTTLDQIIGSVSGGYAYDRGTGFIGDPVAIDNSMVVPFTEDLSCTPTQCVGTFNSTIASLPNPSYNVGLPFRLVDEIIKSYLGNFCCDCDGGPGCTAQQSCYDVHRVTRDIDKRWNSAKVDPKTAFIFDHFRNRCADTWCHLLFSPTCDTSTTTETFTYMRTRQDAYHYTETACCYTETQVGACTLGCSTIPGDECSGFICEPGRCIWQGYKEISFPTKPDCAVAGNVSYDVSHNLHGVAYTESGVVKIGLGSNSDLPIALEVTTTAITGVDWLHLRFDRSGRLWLFTQETGSVYWRRSDDLGDTWTARTLIATGSKPTALLDRANNWYVYWIDGATVKGQVWDRQGTVVQATFTVVASATDNEGLSVDDRFDLKGARRVSLRYVRAGSVRRIASPNGVDTWSVASVVATGKKPAAITRRSQSFNDYFIDGSAMKGVIRNNLDVAVETLFTAIASGVDNAGFGVDESVGQAGAARVIAFYVSGGVLSQAYSFDGKVFV